jgi:hypothetical protein
MANEIIAQKLHTSAFVLSYSIVSFHASEIFMAKMFRFFFFTVRRNWIGLVRNEYKNPISE